MITPRSTKLEKVDTAQSQPQQPINGDNNGNGDGDDTASNGDQIDNEVQQALMEDEIAPVKRKKLKKRLLVSEESTNTSPVSKRRQLEVSKKAPDKEKETEKETVIEQMQTRSGLRPKRSPTKGKKGK